MLYIVSATQQKPKSVPVDGPERINLTLRLPRDVNDKLRGMVKRGYGVSDALFLMGAQLHRRLRRSWAPCGGMSRGPRPSKARASVPSSRGSRASRWKRKASAVKNAGPRASMGARTNALGSVTASLLARCPATRHVST
jgi:hypothetical protein